MRPHERIYRCLLFILPSSMRQEAGDELFETFNQEYARVVDASRWSRVRFWLRMAADLVAASAAERRARVSRRRAAQCLSTSSRLPIMTHLTHTFMNILTDGRLALRRFARMPGGPSSRPVRWRSAALRAARIDPVTTLRQD